MKKRWLLALLAVVPGLIVGLGVIGYGLLLQPPRYRVSSLATEWREPNLPEGVFKSWREGSANRVIGETEPWPHKHPRANSYLLGREGFSGDVEVRLRARFLRGRYLGCYLCYDPSTDSGYWLATGHDVGEDPNEAYIKIVRRGVWEVMASAPLAIIPGKEYRISFSRKGNELVLGVDDEPIVNWRDAEFTKGKVGLRLHNTKLEIWDLTVEGVRKSGGS